MLAQRIGMIGLVLFSILMLILALTAGGCTAATAANLLGYDNIADATTNTRKVVVAYDRTVTNDMARNKERLIADLGKGIAEIAAQTLDAAAAQAAADKAMQLMRTHLANYDEQEKRRAQLYAVAIDNLDYILRICQQGKAFELYRSNVGQQWKQYLQATTRTQTYIETADATPTATSTDPVPLVELQELNGRSIDP